MTTAPTTGPSATRPGDFSPQADAYARARPGYPPALVDLLLEILDLAPRAAVVDLGAGTGIFTALLAARGLAVTALEPNDAMRERARPIDGAVWRAGTFEATGLEDDSQVWAVAAQAFHWADPVRALPELHRVLAPGAPLTVLWNNRDVAASPVLSWTRELIEEMVPGFDEGYRNRDWPQVLTSTGHFAAPFEIAFPHVVEMEVNRYLDLWRSHNLLNAAAGPAGMARLLAAIAARLEKEEVVPVPYLCRAFTARAVRDIEQEEK